MFKKCVNDFFVISGVKASFWRVFIKFRWHGQKFTDVHLHICDWNRFFQMMNIACSTCLESFTSGSDISATPCGHVFHTSCITRWLTRNNDCSQCRKDCDIRQIIKLYFSESQSALEEQITINDLEQKCLKLEEKSQICDREVTNKKKNVEDWWVQYWCKMTEILWNQFRSLFLLKMPGPTSSGFKPPSEEK